MKIYELPYYNIEGEELFEHYKRDLRLIDSVESCKLFIRTWYFLWECVQDRGNDWDRLILNYDVDDKVIEMLKEILKMKNAQVKKEMKKDKGFFQRKEVGIALNLIAPVSTIEALLLAKEYQVSFCTALHQRFCKEKHEDCY